VYVFLVLAVVAMVVVVVFVYMTCLSILWLPDTAEHHVHSLALTP